MTPKEAAKFCRDLQKAAGADAYVSIYLNCHRYDSPDMPALNGMIYTNWPHGETVVDCNADDLETLTKRMADSWEQYKATYRLERIKAIGIAIIKTTDEYGRCTEAALRSAGFTVAEIADLADEATEKANAMANRGPFSIERSANANTPEAA